MQKCVRFVEKNLYAGKYRSAAHSAYNFKFNVPNNGSNYDYHFTIKELANESEGQFDYLGKNTEKYKRFSVLIVKEV